MSASAGKVLLTPKGDYNASTTYSILDWVRYNGAVYVAKQTTTGNLPTDTTYWSLMLNAPANLADLTDVNIDTTTLADGQTLVYNATTGKFENGESSGGVGKDLTGQTVEPEQGTTVTAKTNAEIFNDYRSRTWQSSDIASGNIASGEYSHAEGTRTTATGDYSHAEGFGSRATGNASHAEGYWNNATGGGAHAEGYHTIASGNESHAEGQGTTASGNFSHAEGKDTKALHAYSHISGYGTSGIYQHEQSLETTRACQFIHADWHYPAYYGNFSDSGDGITFAISPSPISVSSNKTEEAKFGASGRLTGSYTCTLTLQVQAIYILIVNSYDKSSGAEYGAAMYLVVANALTGGTPTLIQLGSSGTPPTVTTKTNGIAIKGNGTSYTGIFNMIRVV